MSESGPEDERLQAIYDRLDELDPTTFEADAAKLLHGLGFEEKMMAKATKDMSGATPLLNGNGPALAGPGHSDSLQMPVPDRTLMCTPKRTRTESSVCRSPLQMVPP